MDIVHFFNEVANMCGIFIKPILIFFELIPIDSTAACLRNVLIKLHLLSVASLFVKLNVK